MLDPQGENKVNEVVSGCNSKIADLSFVRWNKWIDVRHVTLVGVGLEQVPKELFTLPEIASINLSSNNITTLPPLTTCRALFLTLADNLLQHLPLAEPQGE